MANREMGPKPEEELGEEAPISKIMPGVREGEEWDTTSRVEEGVEMAQEPGGKAKKSKKKSKKAA